MQYGITNKRLVPETDIIQFDEAGRLPLPSNFMLALEQWNKHRPKFNPFLDFHFLDALQKSGSVSPQTGWQAHVIENSQGALITYKKNHSYGEYIFDWSWADAYAKYGIPYYPKLTSMVPFTPVTTQHFLMPDFKQSVADSLLKEHDKLYEANSFSSAHFLFLSSEEKSVFHNNDYLIRESMQYHFFNEGFESFDQFLEKIKTKKAKNIRNERRFSELKITRYTREQLTEEHAETMYRFYISTILNKNSFDYLNESFFHLIFQNMKNNILYVEATKDESPIGGSLFFYDQEKIYGRYWGSSEYVENLHFELCYYQGIEFCIANKLKVFEAGAQGEHKIARGFRPVKTFSAHKIKHPEFQKAISDFIDQEKEHVEKTIDELSHYLPYR